MLARKILFTLSIVLPAISSIVVPPSYAQDIWLDPKGGPNGAPDYFQLFAPGSPWANAAAKVKVFEVSIQTLTGSTKASDEQLKAMFDWLSQRHIGLALGMLPLTGYPERRCGLQVEGYSSEGQTRNVAQRVRSLGGEPKYYIMDEPLFYGHFYDKQNACRDSIDDIAAQVAKRVEEVRGIFPSVEIGDSEPIHPPVQIADLAKWLDTFQKATGTPLAFLALDMHWEDPDWRRQATQVAQLLSRKGVRLQIIYNGSGRDHSDREWVSHALANARTFESVVKPDIVAIETWHAYPTHVLPDSDATTLTGLVNQYSSLKTSR
jgi:hypothetical protein